MMTWGLAVLSLACLLIAYQNWGLGLPLLVLSFVMMFIARKNAKKEKNKDENNKK